MTDCEFDIFDIMACDVYWDYGTPGLPKEQHKMLVAFYSTKGKFSPDLVDRIECTGPDGYSETIANVEFTGRNRNGFIRDPSTGNYWYMHNITTGFLKEGEYTIAVHCKNGDVKKRSRQQNGARSRALVAAYRKHEVALQKSFVPSEARPMSSQVSLGSVPVRWSTLKDLADQDAYYIFRVAEGRTKADWDVQKLVWWDNIFLERLRDGKAALNRGEVTIGAELKPSNGYLYFVEITDSNAMGETNICIFQPFGSFVTHAGVEQPAFEAASAE